MIEAVISRLEERVPDLAGRTAGATELADLMKRNALPQQTPAAYVLPLGLTGGRESAAAGMYVQEISEAVGVVLTIRSHDRTGQKALATARTLIMAISSALAGWAPDDQTGVFRLRQGRIVDMSAGTFVYQIDFSITDQLRIPT